MGALRARGIGEHALAEFRTMDPDTILETCRWYDEQNGRVRTGVLVEELRAGGRKPSSKPPRSVADQQQAYGEEIVAWLREHFPQWNREDGNRTHTAAIACVIRLHHRHGKGNLSLQEHGPQIRASVKQFEEEVGGT